MGREGFRSFAWPVAAWPLYAMSGVEAICSAHLQLSLYAGMVRYRHLPGPVVAYLLCWEYGAQGSHPSQFQLCLCRLGRAQGSHLANLWAGFFMGCQVLACLPDMTAAYLLHREGRAQGSQLVHLHMSHYVGRAGLGMLSHPCCDSGAVQGGQCMGQSLA